MDNGQIGKIEKGVLVSDIVARATVKADDIATKVIKEMDEYCNNMVDHCCALLTKEKKLPEVMRKDIVLEENQ